MPTYVTEREYVITRGPAYVSEASLWAKDGKRWHILWQDREVNRYLEAGEKLTIKMPVLFLGYDLEVRVCKLKGKPTVQKVTIKALSTKKGGDR